MTGLRVHVISHQVVKCQTKRHLLRDCESFQLIFSLERWRERRTNRRPGCEEKECKSVCCC